MTRFEEKKRGGPETFSGNAKTPISGLSLP